MTLFAEPTLFDSVLKYGQSSTVFLTLYEGFSSFSWSQREGKVLIPYVDTSSCWVGASEPLGPSSDSPKHLDAIEGFFKGAQKLGKSALLLPVDKSYAEIARNAGHYVLQIGVEARFTLKAFDLVEHYFRLPVARRLKARGAVFAPFDPMTLSERGRSELDQLIKNWFESKPSAPFQFLNRVEPWLFVGHKRYFKVSFHGQTLAFLSAAPVPARNAWYFGDLIRSPIAPPGTMELLIGEAMEVLKNEGASDVSLGLVSMANLDPSEETLHPKAFPILKWLYENGEALYAFKSLYAFKNKFGPTHWEPLYLIASPSFNFSAMRGIFRAHYPDGFLKVIGSTLAKKLRSFKGLSIYDKLLTSRLVPRPPPRSFGALILRCKAVLALTAMNALMYIAATNNEGTQIRPAMESRFAYSFAKFITSNPSTDDLRTLLISSFLHWNLSHLLLNFLLFVIFGGLLEVIAGSTITFSAYLLGLLLSNPLTSALLYPVLLMVDPERLPAFITEKDIGCSLGVSACLGVLVHFVRRPILAASLVVIGVFASALWTSSLLALNHLVALGIGILCASIYAPKRWRASDFV